MGILDQPARKILQLFLSHPGQNEESLIKLGDFMGVEVETRHASESARSLGETTSEKGPLCIVASGAALEGFCCAAGGIEEGKDLLCGAGNLFVYGFKETSSPDELIQTFTGRALSSFEFPVSREGKFSFSEESRFFSGPFAGLPFGPIGTSGDLTFRPGDRYSQAEPLAFCEGNPFLASISLKGGRLFISGQSGIPDIDQEVLPGESIKTWFSTLLPPMMFIRWVFGDRCWQADRHYAGLIIDDPLLKDSYGFLNFRELVHKMNLVDFTSSVAFIPWNFRRSDRETVDLFLRNPGRLSLCVHGCDHTEGEFASTDTRSLRSKAALALRRMEEHAAITGIGYDDVMVFPQGRFSLAGMQALKQCGYLAAVCSTPFTQGHEVGLRLRDFLECAYLNYSDFVLFSRRYPIDPAEIAFDFFIGRPVLIASHHDTFKNNGKGLIDFIEGIHRLNSGTTWGSLGEILSRSCLKRRSGNLWQVKFYTRRLILKNRSQHPELFFLTKKEDPNAGIDRVTLNGREVEYFLRKGSLETIFELGGDEEAVLEVFYPAQERFTGFPLDQGEVSTLLRRRLSEWRDNYLSRSDLLLQLSRALRKVLPM